MHTSFYTILNSILGGHAYSCSIIMQYLIQAASSHQLTCKEIYFCIFSSFIEIWKYVFLTSFLLKPHNFTASIEPFHFLLLLFRRITKFWKYSQLVKSSTHIVDMQNNVKKVHINRPRRAWEKMKSVSLLSLLTLSCFNLFVIITRKRAYFHLGFLSLY